MFDFFNDFKIAYFKQYQRKYYTKSNIKRSLSIRLKNADAVLSEFVKEGY